MGIKLFLVSIGTHARSKDFVEVTGFPADCLFADPESTLYGSMGLVKGVGATFLAWDTPLAIKRRMDEGRTGDLADVLSRWKPWTPPKSDQAFQQGGLFLFEGPVSRLSHYDPATGAHADLGELLLLAGRLAEGAEGECGAACELPVAQSGAAGRPQE